MPATDLVFRPMVNVLNRRIRGNSAALAIARELAGRQVALRVRDTGLVLPVSIEPDGVRLDELADEPDVVIEGTLTGLVSLGGDDPLAAIRDRRVTLDGDAYTAEQFQRLLGLARPDAEEEAAELIGDRAAAALGKFVNEARNWGRSALGSIEARVGERLADSDRIPSREEVDEFTRDVRALRDSAARLSARIDRLRERRTGD